MGRIWPIRPASSRSCSDGRWAARVVQAQSADLVTPAAWQAAGYREPCGLLSVDAAGAPHGVEVSVTQKATVRFSRSRSIPRVAFSRSSRPTRACWSLVSPPWAPRSMRSCRTQLPSVES
jgi:hypothetical protein